MNDRQAVTGTDMSMVFAALADPTRLALIETLSDGESRSIVALSQNGSITRQAVTKHLTVLERALLVER
ncbi:MAG: ArsR/SmtB family transcription factor, partial [Candidatus Binatia bacterium]